MIKRAFLALAPLLTVMIVDTLGYFAVWHADDRIDNNPSPEAVLHKRDRLIVFGTPTQIDALSADD